MAMTTDMDGQQAQAHGKAVDHSKGANLIFLVLGLVVVLEVLAFMVWGPVVLTLTALVLVPCMFVFFVAISWPGKARPKG